MSIFNLILQLLPSILAIIKQVQDGLQDVDPHALNSAMTAATALTVPFPGINTEVKKIHTILMAHVNANAAMRTPAKPVPVQPPPAPVPHPPVQPPAPPVPVVR